MTTPSSTPCFLSLPASAQGTPVEQAAKDLLAVRGFVVLPPPPLDALTLEVISNPYDPSSSQDAARAAIVALPFPDGALGFDQYRVLRHVDAEEKSRPAFILSPDGHDMTPAGDYQQEFVCLSNYNTQEYDRHYSSVGYGSHAPAPRMAGTPDEMIKASSVPPRPRR